MVNKSVETPPENSTLAVIPKFKLFRAIDTSVKSDKFWSFCNLPPTVVVKATTSESPFAIEAEISSNVSNAAPAPPIKSVI